MLLRCLTTVDHDLVVETHLLVDEEVSDVGSLVSRELQDLAQLHVDVDAPVALEGLLQGLRDFLNIQILRQSLHRRDALAPISLLDANVNLGVVTPLLLGSGERVVRVLEVYGIHAFVRMQLLMRPKVVKQWHAGALCEARPDHSFW